MLGLECTFIDFGNLGIVMQNIVEFIAMAGFDTLLSVISVQFSSKAFTHNDVLVVRLK